MAKILATIFAPLLRKAVTIIINNFADEKLSVTSYERFGKSIAEFVFKLEKWAKKSKKIKADDKMVWWLVEAMRHAIKIINGRAAQDPAGEL